jgi:phage terminase small subunit
MQNRLTEKQETFALMVIDGLSLSDAYRQSYRAEHMKSPTIHVEASRLAINPKVALRIQELLCQKDEDRHMQGLRREDFVLESLKNESLTATTDSARIRALELLGKTIGMFDGRGGKEEPPELTAEELEQKLKQKLEEYFGRHTYAQ